MWGRVVLGGMWVRTAVGARRLDPLSEPQARNLGGKVVGCKR